MKINFAIIIPTPKLMIFVTYMTCEGEKVGVSAAAKVKMTIQQAQSKLRYADGIVPGKLEKMMRWELKQVKAPEYLITSEDIEAQNAVDDVDMASDVDVDDVEEPGIKAREGDSQLNDAKADEANAVEGKADAGKADEAKADEAKADEAKTDEAKTEEDEDNGNAEESVVQQESVEENVAIEDFAEDIAATTPTGNASQADKVRQNSETTHLFD